MKGVCSKETQETYTLIHSSPDGISTRKVSTRHRITSNNACSHIYRVASHQRVIKGSSDSGHPTHTAFSRRHIDLGSREHFATKKSFLFVRSLFHRSDRFGQYHFSIQCRIFDSDKDCTTKKMRGIDVRL